MSGGSMDYLYLKVQMATFKTDTAERRAFRKHLAWVATALQAIEWVDSGDSAEGSENAAIRVCLPPMAVLDQAIENATMEIATAMAELEHVKEQRTKVSE